MQKWVKGLGIVVIVLIIFLISIYALFSLYFTPPRLKALVVPRLTASLGRQVELKGIKFNIFKGLEIKEFSVKEARGFPEGQFISCDKLILRYRFWPLLRKRLEIGKLVLERPHVEIIKNRGGRFNFEDIVSRFKKEAASAPPSKKGEKTGMGLTLFISEVQIKDGTAVFRDFKQGTRLTLEKTNLAARDISLTHPFPVRFSCLLNKVSVAIQGKIDLSVPKTDLTVKALAPDVSPLLPLLPPGLITKLKGAAELRFRLNTQGTNNAQVKGTLKGKNIAFCLPQQRTYKNLNIETAFDLLWNGLQRSVTLRKAHTLINNFSLETTGFIQKKEMQLRLNIPLQSLKPLIRLTSEGIPVKIKDGNLKARAVIKSTDMVVFNGIGQLDVYDLVLTAQNKTYRDIDFTLKADVVLRPQPSELMLNSCDINFKDTELGLKGFMSPKWIKVHCYLPRLTLASFTAFVPGLTEMRGQVSADLAIEGNPRLLPGLAINGSVSLQDISLKLEDMPLISAVKGKFSLRKQDALFITPLSGKIGTTYFKLTGEIKHFLDKPMFALDAELHKLPVEQWLGWKSFKTANTAHTSQAKPRQDKEIAPLNLPFTARGRLKIYELSYKKVMFSKLITDYRLRDNVLVLNPIYGQLQRGGTVKGKVKVDLGKKGIMYDLNFRLDSIDIGNLSQSFLSPSVGQLQGKGNLVTQVKGRGVTSVSLERYLNGWMNMSFTNGAFRGNPILQKVAEFLDIEALANPKFREFKGNLEVKQGKIEIKGKMKERNYGLFLKGYSTVTGRLDLQSDITLNANLVKSRKAKRIFKLVPLNKEGYYLVPLLIQGKIDAPKIALNTKVIEEKIKEKAQQKIEKLLKKQIKKTPLPEFLFERR